MLYRKEEGGLQALGGSIPFEEAINVPDLDEKDYVSVSWQLEDLNTEMIHSRKLGIKACDSWRRRQKACMIQRQPWMCVGKMMKSISR